MANQKDIDLLLELLNRLPDVDSKNPAAYQLGYLIGFFAELMNYDSLIRSQIIQRINYLSEEK